MKKQKIKIIVPVVLEYEGDLSEILADLLEGINRENWFVSGVVGMRNSFYRYVKDKDQKTRIETE